MQKPQITLAFFSLLFSAALTAPTSAQENAATNTIYDIDLSPDGKSYAILRQYQGQRIVAVYDADDATKPPMAVGLGDLPTRDFAWGGDSHVLVQVSGEKTGLRTTDGLQDLEIARWMVIDKNTGEMKTVFTNEVGDDYTYFINSAGDLISTLPGKPTHALFARASVSIRPGGPSRLKDGRDDVNYSLQELNLNRTRARVVESGNESTIDWAENEAGDAILRVDAPSDNRITIHTRPSGKGGFKQVADINYDNSAYNNVKFYGPTEQPGAVQALVTENGGTQKLMGFDLQTGAFDETLFAPSSGYVQTVHYDHGRGRALAAISSDGVKHLNSADAADVVKLEKAVPGSSMLLMSSSTDGGRSIVKAFKTDGNTEYYFYDAPGRRLEMIAVE